MAQARTPAHVYHQFFVPGIFGPSTRELLAFLPPRRGERVLDLACGTGVVARAVAPLVGGEGRVTGLDLRPGMLAVASSLPAPDGARIEWVEGDALALEFEDASFDLVFCQHGLQFFPDKDKAISEMRRVLAPGGRVGLAVWQGFDRNTFFGAMTEIEARGLADVGMSYEELAQPFLFGDPEWLRGLVEDAGFGESRVEPRTIEVRLPHDGFVENVEFAYSAVVPEFANEPSAFAAFVEAVEGDLQSLLARHREGDEIVFPLHLNAAAGRAPADPR